MGRGECKSLIRYTKEGRQEGVREGCQCSKRSVKKSVGWLAGWLEVSVGGKQGSMRSGVGLDER